MGLEAHVHDTTRFKGGWGFFALNGTAPAKMIPHAAACYACHQAMATWTPRSRNFTRPPNRSRSRWGPIGSHKSEWTGAPVRCGVRCNRMIALVVGPQGEDASAPEARWVASRRGSAAAGWTIFT